MKTIDQVNTELESQDDSNFSLLKRIASRSLLDQIYASPLAGGPALIESQPTETDRVKESQRTKFKNTPLPDNSSLIQDLIEGSLESVASGSAFMGPAGIIAELISDPVGDAEATIVPALAKLKGLAGIHPNFDLDKFLKLEQAGASPLALEKKFGIFRDAEGLKTNISDKGLTFTPEASTKLLGAYMEPFSTLFAHPNSKTLDVALDTPNFLDNVYVTSEDLGGSLGQHYQALGRSFTSIDPALIMQRARGDNVAALKEILDVAQHEGLGHGVQAKLGWQSGSAPEYSRSKAEFVEYLKTTPQGSSSLEDFMEDAAYEIYQRHAGEQGANAAVKSRNAAEKGWNEFQPITSYFSVPPSKQIFTKD